MLGLVVALSLAYTALEYSTEGEPESNMANLDPKKMQHDPDLIVAIDREEDASAHSQKSHDEVADRLNVRISDHNRIDASDKGTEQARNNDAAYDGREDNPSAIVVVDEPQKAHQELNSPSPVTLKAPPSIPVNETETHDKERVLTETPTPPGGWVAFMKWITKTLVYPPQARSTKLEGVTNVAFIVEADGSVSDIHLETSGGTLFDEEVLRVIRQMGRWKAGIDHGKPCRSMVEIPIVFKL